MPAAVRLDNIMQRVINTFAGLITLLCLSASAVSATPATTTLPSKTNQPTPIIAPSDASSWRLVSDKSGIQVYTKHEDTSRIKTFRGVTRFRMDKLNVLSGVLNDTPNMPRWMHFVSKTKEIRRSDYLNREYQFLTSLPWPLADREAIVRLLIRQPPEANGGVIIYVRSAPELLPPDKNYIRINQMDGIFSIVPTGNPQEIQVTYELIMDPGGYIPAWAANIVLKDIPHFTLERLRRIINRPEYQAWQDPVITFPW